VNRLVIPLYQRNRKVILYLFCCRDQLITYSVFSFFRLVEILIKEDGKFLDLTGVPVPLKLRSGLGKYLYVRECYQDLIDDIIASLPKKSRKTIAILGTAGIGKSSLFLVVLKLFLEDPTRFGLKTRSFTTRHCHTGPFSTTTRAAPLSLFVLLKFAKDWTHRSLSLLTWKPNLVHRRSTLAFL
jgi:hypothetical protein